MSETSGLTPLGPDDPPFVLLDDFTTAGEQSWLFTNPVEIIETSDPGEVSDCLKRIDDGRQRGLHAAGFIAYELGLALEPRLHRQSAARTGTQLIWIGLFEQPNRLMRREVGDWLAALARDYVIVNHHLSWDRDQYADRFKTVKQMIASGDIYQLNLTFKTHFQLHGSSLGLYRDLRAGQPVAYGGLIATQKQTILTASPELFIAINGNAIETRPMKGTSARATSPADDKAICRQLATDPKQRAENLMIVDLMRNDLSRISEIGSVEVTDLFTVETLPTLHQMTSGIRAQLIAGTNLNEIMNAIFPAGSITGAPKIRAMELIAELEPQPRGAYCGAIGHIAPSGDAQFNVAIRTLTIDSDGRGEMGIGSGIVYDSLCEEEYAECLLKKKFLTGVAQPLQLIETLLYAPGDGYWLLQRHIDRLCKSSRHFAIQFNEAKIRAALEKEAAKAPDKRQRVRLLLGAQGDVSITSTPLPTNSDAPPIRFVISPTRLHSADPFLRHKTTRREVYDREWQQFNESLGADEVIYLNERDELCEGSRTNLFIERNGNLLTPPLSSGLLPGTLRAELIDTGGAHEQILTLADLSRADRLFLGNSVRGLQPATALTEPKSP